MFDDTTFSACGRYRFTLTRRVCMLGHLKDQSVTFVMLNPSTADASVNDPTIRRCMGFARSWGFGGLRVVNLYAWRATKPADLWIAYRGRACITGGPENDNAIRDAARQSVRVVVAWGAHAEPDRAAEVLALLREVDASPLCLGTTKSGAPRHPLMLPRGTVPLPFEIEEAA